MPKPSRPTPSEFAVHLITQWSGSREKLIETLSSKLAARDRDIAREAAEKMRLRISRWVGEHDNLGAIAMTDILNFPLDTPAGEAAEKPSEAQCRHAILTCGTDTGGVTKCVTCGSTDVPQMAGTQGPSDPQPAKER
jgi:hypothetical protein